MNDPHSSHDDLLDDMLGEQGVGLSANEVLRLVRRERRAARRRAVAMAAGSAVVLAAALVLLRPAPPEPLQTAGPQPRPATPGPAAATEAVPPLRVERISDDQLLEMLAQESVGLIQLPDGGRRLLMITRR
jgi:hypothetical protein